MVAWNITHTNHQSISLFLLKRVLLPPVRNSVVNFDSYMSAPGVNLRELKLMRTTSIKWSLVNPLVHIPRPRDSLQHYTGVSGSHRQPWPVSKSSGSHFILLNFETQISPAKVVMMNTTNTQYCWIYFLGHVISHSFKTQIKLAIEGSD